MIVGARCRSLDSYWLIVSTSCQGRGARVQHVAIDLEPDHATLGQAAFGARDSSSFQVDACQAVAGKAEERCDRVLDSGRRLQGQMFNPFRKLVTVDTRYYHEGSPGREVDVGWRAGPTIEKIDNRTRRRRRLRTSGFKPGAPRHRLRRPTTFLGQASIREARFLRMMRAAGALPHVLKYIKADEVILPILEVLVNLGDGEPPSQHAEPPPAILEDEREENAEDEVGDGELARKVPRTNETEGTRAPGQCSLCCKRLRKKNYLDVAVWTGRPAFNNVLGSANGKRVEASDAEYAGRLIEGKGDHLAVSREKYIPEQVTAVPLTRERKRLQGEKLSPSKFEAFRSLVYKLNWLGRETPEAAGAASIMASRLQVAIVQDVILVNQFVNHFRNTAKML
ncbi:unnamed protein product [Symbiodinium necroappetens]|uniref:Uncharacterized protein n=1 Tax=Symbiodinium necroappetens TaxID=1628268 RepID=A0A812K905_9DINO|nr:unnamed protein product [Symbiodinium necroappetens]